MAEAKLTTCFEGFGRKRTADQGESFAGRSDANSFDLVKRNLVACAVVELGGAWGLVGRDRLRIFGGAAVLQGGGDAGRPERVATGGRGESRVIGASLDQPQDIRPAYRPFGHAPLPV